MKPTWLTTLLWCMSAAILALWADTAVAAPDPDPFQRYIIITNELPLTAYPVVQVPEDGNCVPKSTRVRRIVVNYSATEPGLPPGKTARVQIPKTCWYNAGRLYIFSVRLQAFEERLHATERTIPDTPPLPDPVCSEPADNQCYSGSADASYPLDAPAQLVEYTFDALDPVTGDTTKDPNDPAGIPMTDIDISFVDELYLPVGMTLDDGGASRYMGTILPYEIFNQRTQEYINNPKANWSSFAAYTPDNWPNNVFHDLGPAQTSHVPGGYNLFQLVDSAALSELYTPAPTGPAECSAWAGCANLAGNCCPANDGTFLSCCGIDSFIIANTSAGTEPGKATNPSVAAATARWNLWLTGTLCADLQAITTWPSDAPQFDKQTFCDTFQTTVQYVWTTFQATDEVQQDCATDMGDELTQCIIRHILGYTSKVLSGRLPESIQAVQRNVPWGDSGELQYQFDKWLLFWAPYDSIFNLNPYTRLIHNDTEGVNAVAYSFSIDDKYGNYRERASGFIADLGGSSSLVNKQAYDPYEQYFINWADGWEHATVCGRDVTIGSRPGNARVFFWQGGVKQPYCDVTLYTPGTSFVKFRLTETTATVVDPYTGIGGHEVHGIGHADPNYCATNSSPNLVAQHVCSDATLASVDKGDTAYVNLPADQRPTVNLDVPPAPQIIGAPAPNPDDTRWVKFRGTAARVGSGVANGKVSLGGKLTNVHAPDLRFTSLTVRQLLFESASAAELVRQSGGTSLLPLTLSPRRGSSATAAMYETAPGVVPRVRVALKRRNPEKGEVEFKAKVGRAKVEGAAACGGTGEGNTKLRTRMVLTNSVGASVVLATEQLWECDGDTLQTP